MTFTSKIPDKSCIRWLWTCNEETLGSEALVLPFSCRQKNWFLAPSAQSATK